MPQGKSLVFTNEQLSNIETRYLAGESANAIGKTYGCAHTVITRLAKLNGYNRTKTEAAALTRAVVDEDYFEIIDTEEKAYWLGFLYADGGITASSQKALYVGLARKDRNHIVALQTALKTNFSVGDYTNNQHREISVLRVSNSKIVDDLIALGCTERKTFTLQPPDNNQVPPELIRHFVRGYLDGDGCISTTRAFQVIFLGTKVFLSWIKKVLPLQNNAKVYQPNSKNISRFTLHCNQENKWTLYDWLYEGASIWLERKRIKFIES